MTHARVRIACTAAGLGLALAGCHQSAVARLSALDPSERAAAIVSLADAGDASAVHKLVDLLEDRDLGVRMYANLALVRLCGTDYGYHYYDPEPVRGRAVDRWRDALRDGQVTVLPPAARTAPGISAYPDATPAPERAPEEGGAP
jgi:HEAT repeat protein